MAITIEQLAARLAAEAARRAMSTDALVDELAPLAVSSVAGPRTPRLV